MAIDTALRSRERRRNLLSYLMISIVPILICGVLLGVNFYKMRNELTDRQALDGLNVFSKTYGALLSGMDSCTGHLQDNLDQYEGRESDSIPAQLISYKNNYSLYDDVFYYKRGDAYIYTDNGMEKYEVFEHRWSGDTGVDLTMSNFFLTINRTVSNTALRSVSVGDGHEDGEYIFYIRTVPVLDAHPEGALIFCVSTEKLQEMLDICVPARHAVYSYSDRYMSWLYRSGVDENSYVQNSLERMGTAGVSHTDIAGREYILLRAVYEQDETYHMLAYSADELYSESRAELNRTLLILVLVLLPVGAAAFLIHRYTFSPINELMQLDMPEADGEDTADSALKDVVNRARGMIRENDKLKLSLDDRQAVLRAQHIMSLLTTGRSDRSDSAPDMPYRVYTALFAFTASESGKFADSGFAEMRGEDMVIYMVSLPEQGHAAILCNHNGSDRDGLLKALTAMTVQQGIVIRGCGAGVSQLRPERIPVSYAQAQAIARASGENSFVLFSADEDTQSVTGFLPVQSRLLLRQCMRGANTEIALSTLYKMHSDVLPLLSDGTIARSWCFFVYETVADVLRENRLDELLSDIPMEEVLYAPIDEFMLHMEHLITHGCASIGRAEERLTGQKQADMLNYAEENFRDGSLSLTVIADRFGYSENYVTRFFKQTLGESFTQYIARRRMEWVKERLAYSDEPIGDIIRAAGYSDAANFTRKFRQTEGMTPGQYRAQKANGGMTA